MFFVQGRTTSGGDLLSLEALGRLDPGLAEQPRLALMASFVVIWAPHPALGKAELLLCGDPPTQKSGLHLGLVLTELLG